MKSCQAFGPTPKKSRLSDGAYLEDALPSRCGRADESRSLLRDGQIYPVDVVNAHLQPGIGFLFIVTDAAWDQGLEMHA